MDNVEEGVFSQFSLFEHHWTKGRAGEHLILNKEQRWKKTLTPQGLRFARSTGVSIGRKAFPKHDDGW